MTAALFLIEPAVAAAAGVGDVIALSGPEGRHAVAVKRVGFGERIALGDGAGTVLHAVVESLSGRDSLRARVQGRTDTPPPQPRVIVVQALPKGDRGETAVETLTEVGVDVIVPWQAERAVARWTGDKIERGRTKWAVAARAAAKQARRPWLPEVAPMARTADVEALVAGAARAIVLHEEALVSVRDLAVPEVGDVVLIVGPEGGLSPAELDRFSAAGAHLALLGPTVMRTSTAGTVAAAVVLAATPRWS